MKVQTLDGVSPEKVTELKGVYQTKGWNGFWRAQLAFARIEPAHFPTLELAEISVRIGDKNQAFEWLEKAYQEHDTYSLPPIKVDPLLDDIRSDPRFQDLLRRIRLN